MVKLRINNIVKYTVVDGHGLRLSIYTQGCSHLCPGCHNPQTHDKDGGHLIDLDDLKELIGHMPYINGVTLTGGDPLFQWKEILELARWIKSSTKLDIVMYTGYEYEEIDALFPGILDYIDFVVDGCFSLAHKSYDLYFTGSTNQKYVDVSATKDKGEIVLRHRRSWSDIPRRVKHANRD